MKSQPLIIFVTSSNVPVCTKHFACSRKAKEWLRAEGCHFPNDSLANLGEESLELLTEEYEYEIQVDARRQGRRGSIKK